MQIFGPSQISNTSPFTPFDAGSVPAGTYGDASTGTSVGSTITTPNFLQLQDTGDLSLQPGMQLRGQVTNTNGNSVTLQFGDNELTATTNLPLFEGQQVDVEVTGQQQNGQWSLQLTGSVLYTPMSDGDITAALMDLNLPPSDSNVDVAKTMVTMGLALNANDVQELVQNLAQLPREATPQDMQAAVFLKAGSLPLGDGNLTTLASFITEHPFIGATLMPLQGALRKLLNDPTSRTSMSDMLIELLEEAPGVLGEMVLDPLKTPSKKMQDQLKDAAFQAGIGSLGQHVGDDFDMQQWLRTLRELIYSMQPMTPEMGAAAALFGDLEENFAAMRLLNSAACAEQGSFYFQIPLKDREDSAESKLIYHVDIQGRPIFDEANCQLEVMVPTDNMGNVSWQVVARCGILSLDAAVDTEQGRRAIESALPTLVNRLRALGYIVGTPTCRPRRKVEQAGMKPVVAAEFETLERVNIRW